MKDPISLHQYGKVNFQNMSNVLLGQAANNTGWMIEN